MTTASRPRGWSPKERIADTPHVEIRRARQANSIFARLPEHAVEPLRKRSSFWPWDATGPIAQDTHCVAA
jgi:threonine aldolase